MPHLSPTRRLNCSGAALRLCRLLFCFSALMVACAARPAEAITLVRDHQPAATIVVSKDAPPQIRNAAQTLQTYIAQSTRATLPIRESAGGGAALHVGSTPYVAGQKLNLQNLDEDGFILRATDTDNLVILGGSDWGTEFGVYDFLERYLGVRWLMPTAIGEDVPQRATLDLPDNVNVREEPAYLSRELSPLRDLDADNPNSQWARFNRARGRVAFHHNLLNLFPVSKFGKTNPEFYPEVKGKRYIPKDDADFGWEPNLSAPGIVDAAVAQIEKYFEENPTATSYSLGMNDSNLWDESDASRARRSGKRNYLGLEDISDDYFLWANEVVERVLQKYPDKWFGTLAYNGLAEPPAKVGVHPRIVPFITYERMRWEDPKLRDFGQQLTERWAKVSPTVGWYDYAYGLNYLLPRVWPHRMQKYLLWGAQHQVKFHYAELYPNWGTGAKAWVYSKLQWNPNQDVDALLNDWYQHAAGDKATPKLKAFYEIWEKFWTVDLYQTSWNNSADQYLPFYQLPSYLGDVTPAMLTRSEQLMQEALQLTDTPQRKARVAKLNEMWQLYRASIVTYQSANSGIADPQNEGEALALLQHVKTVIEQADRRQKTLEAFRRDPLFQLSANSILRTASTRGDDWGYSLLWRLAPWVERSPAVKAQITALAGGENATASQARALLRVAAGESQLVSANPSFEDGLKGWTFWDKSEESPDYHKGSFTVSSDAVKTGANSLLVKGLGRGAPMQTIPYQAGDYLATVHCFVPQDSTTGNVSLQLTATGVKGVVLPTTNNPLQPGHWTSITVPFTLPPTTNEEAEVRLLLLIDGFAPDGEVYVDDVAIYRLD